MAETYAGEVRGGVVVFDGGTPPLPEGAKVQVAPVEIAEAPAPPTGQDAVAATRALLVAWGKKAESIVSGLPRDLAENHDHYAHGKPGE